MKSTLFFGKIYQQTIIISILFLFIAFSTEGSVKLKWENDYKEIATLQKESTMLLPLNEVASFYNAELEWNSVREQVKLSKSDVNIRFTLGNPHILINGSKLGLLSTPPSIYQSVIAISPQDTAIILSNLIPSMNFAYNDSDQTITAIKPENPKSSNKANTNFNDLIDNNSLPGNFNLKTIVIDPGHGGHDGGASRAGVHEKDVVLDISKRLAKILKEKTLFQVVMTRDTDEFIPLHQRTSIANNYPADSTLFICIHINASPSKTGGRGTETYVFDLEATDQEARALAKRENEGESMDLTMILSHCYHVGTEPYSLKIAEIVQRTLTSELDLYDRGVKRAPFYVLAGTKMPAILIELAYVSNPSEREKLSNPFFRQKTAEALFDAIMSFKSAVDRSLAKAKPN